MQLVLIREEYYFQIFFADIIENSKYLNMIESLDRGLLDI